MHQTIQNSKLDKNAKGKIDVPWGPTFYPTVEEMEGSPMDYIEKIRPIAQHYGICKIVPPKGWNPGPVCKLNIQAYCLPVTENYAAALREGFQGKLRRFEKLHL